MKELQSSEPLHAKLNPTSCLFGLRFAYLQAVIFFRQTVFHKCGRGIYCSLGSGLQPSFRNPHLNRAPLWWIFYQITERQPIGRQDSMQTVIRTSRRLDTFLHKEAQNFELKYSRSKLKNQKHIAVDVLFKAYPMIPLLA